MEDNTRRDYHRRIICIAIFLEEHYPIWYSTGVWEVPEIDFTDKLKFYYGCNYKKDLVYVWLNVKFVVKFWMEDKVNKSEKLKSLMDARKYKDAIMLGC